MRYTTQKIANTNALNLPRWPSVIFLLLLLNANCIYGEVTSIHKLRIKADDYINTQVEIKAYVVYQEDTEEDVIDAKSVYVYDRSSDTILLNSSKSISWEKDYLYRIEGDLKRNAEGVLELAYSKRECLDCQEDENNMMEILLYTLIALVVIGAIFWWKTSKKKSAPKTDPLEKYTRTTAQTQTEPAQPHASASDNYGTIAFNMSEFMGTSESASGPAKTMVMQGMANAGPQKIPGTFLVKLLNEAEQRVEVYGVASSIGFIATIGREQAGKENESTHLLVNNNTVSRRQAELVYKNNALYLKNLSGTNPTRLNKVEMKVGQELELSDGMEIAMGTAYIIYRKNQA